METNTQNRKIDITFILLTVLCAVGIVLCYGVMFLPVMIVLPALWAAAAFKSGAALPVSIGLGLFTVLYGLFIGYDLAFTLRILLLTAPPSVLLYVAHRYRLGNTQAALYLSVSLTFGLFAVFCMDSLRRGLPAFHDVRLLFDSMLKTLETGMSPSATVLVTFREYVTNIDIYFPSVLYCFGAFQAFTNVLALHLINHRKKQMPLVPMRPIGQWRLPRPYVLACVAVMVVSLIVSYTGSGKSDMILLLSNYMLNLPLSLVGAGMLFALMTRRKKGPLMILLFLVILVVLILIGLAMYTLSILGFLGCISVRRRDRQA